MKKSKSFVEPDIKEIQGYLTSRQSKYLQVLSKIKNRFMDYWQYDTLGRRYLYRVATRADYEFGNELKTVQSVYRKMRENRERGKASYGIDDVEDIVGIRLVCVYPTDINCVLKFCKLLHQEGFFGHFEYELIKRETGYQAYHVNVALPDVDLADYKCEIQILTMLEEAWSYKAHELIYKPEETITPEQKEQAKILSDMLHNVDQQSQLLERQIRREVEEESQRKYVARLEIMAGMSKIDRTTKEELCKIRDKIIEDRSKLRVGDTKNILRRVGVYVDKEGIDLDVCKVIMLLCAVREPDDLNQFAIDHVERLIRQLIAKKDKPNLLDAYRSAGLLYYCVGLHTRAIGMTEEALKISEKLQDSVESSRLKSNIAYFIVDGNIKVKKKLAIKYAKEAHNSQPDDCAFLDTLGYVYIVFGNTYDEIKDGLSKCEEAFENDPNKNIAAPYFNLHSKAAYKRLMEL